MSASLAVRVLVVDDEEVNRETELSLLHAHLIDAHAVSGADAALRALANDVFDAVLTDVNLRNRPGDRSGVELARQIRASDATIGIVGYSAQVRDLGRNERKAFDLYFQRSDDPPEALVAGAVRAASGRTVPRVRYPVLGIGVVTVDLALAGEDADLREEVNTVDPELAEHFPISLVMEPTGRGRLRRPLRVAVHDEPGSVDVVVPEHPVLLGHGDTLDTALADLFETMEELDTELCQDDDALLGPSVLALKSALTESLERS